MVTPIMQLYVEQTALFVFFEQSFCA